MLPITTLTTSILALLYVWLSLHVIKQRRVTKVSLGTGDQESLLKVVRAHGNFSEYVPLIIFLLAFSEANECYPVLLTILAMIIILGRTLHVFAFLYSKNHFKYRVHGMKMTITPIVILSLINIFLVLKNFFD